jgi:hypothetical protein
MSPKEKRKISKGTSNPYRPVRPELPPSAPVIFIHPSKQGMRFHPQGEFGRPYGLIPVGLPAIVNLIRKNGIEVKGINHSLEMQLNPNFNLKNWLVSQRDAQIALIDMHWYEHCYGAIEMARLCKQFNPKILTVLGGLSASGFAREILENFSEVDIVVRGDGEKPVLELVQKYLAVIGDQGSGTGSDVMTILPGIPNISYHSPDGIKENPLMYTGTTIDLDELDYVDLSFLEHSREYFVHEYIVTDLAKARQALESNPYRGRWLTTARGCKYECAYCGGGKSSHKILANRKGIVIRSPGKVVEDLVRLQESGITQASLAYDIAELGDEYWKPFFAGMREKNLKIGIYNEFFQMPEFDFVEDMVQSVNHEHSCVALSPLSGNERVRRLNGKHFSNTQLFDMLELLSRHRMYLFVYFSLNLPGETDETFKETLELAQEIFYFYPNSLLKILNTVHTIDPLSPMNLKADRFGVISSMVTFMDFYHYCQNTQEQDPASRVGVHRGFELADPESRSLAKMADAWDRAREGKEMSWWPIPPSW